MRTKTIIFSTLLMASVAGFAQDRDTLQVKEINDELKEVSIVSTRSSRTIERIPTRIEFVSSEEVGEKINMKPGDIRVMMSESTGITTQQTSAISGNSAIRIQGLDGRYTLILKDGMPAFPAPPAASASCRPRRWTSARSKSSRDPLPRCMAGERSPDWSTS